MFNELQGLPQSASEYQRDEAFVRWRLAGPNPMAIQKCTEEMLAKKLNLGSLTPQTQVKQTFFECKSMLNEQILIRQQLDRRLARIVSLLWTIQFWRH